MGSVFKFKQFDVDQSGCGMKINTDGVLLAATVVKESALYILDIGTGTGVIALMLAQRFPQAKIDAVEIDESATHTAASNFSNSSFSDRLKAHHVSIADYKTDIKYDLIVSNPPYFVNDLRNAEKKKELARHADEDFFKVLVSKAADLLSATGTLWLILPVKQADFVIARAELSGMFLQREISICSDVNKPIIRKIICVGRTKEDVDRTMFYIYEAEQVYTSAYKQLLKDFFLAF